MEAIISKALPGQLDDCERALVNSELGRRYFSAPKSARKAVEEAL